MIQVRVKHIWAVFVPLLLATTLAGWSQMQSVLNTSVPRLKPVYLDSVAHIEWLFDELDFTWPLTNEATVPRLTVTSLPDDLDSQVNKARKKSLFIRMLLPLVLAENERIQAQRRFLQHVFSHPLPAPGSEEARRLQQLSKYYRVTGRWQDSDFQRRLLERVDSVPLALVIAQAANESGWGTSRFAQQANNLFGQWTFDQRQGLVPRERDAGLGHFVRIFPSLRASVRAYLHNLNTHRAYQPLRKLRRQLREQQLAVNASALVAGLKLYSQRGQHYVEEIRHLIAANRLERLEMMRLRDGSARLVIPRQFPAESKPS